MYAITEGKININDQEIRTFSRNVKHVNNILDVEAGSTGFRGYTSREKSSRTYIGIKCKKGDFLFNPVKSEDGKIMGIEIACCGDGALMALVDSVSFIVDALIDDCK